MALLRSLIMSALLAGAIVGAVASLMHLTATVPVVLMAEKFENGTSSGHHHEVAAAQSHAHEPAAGGSLFSERNLLTIGAMVLAYVGFALLLGVCAEMVGGLNNWRDGIKWGAAGFATFTLFPAIGLPPELPGMPAADLLMRQLWWIGTATCVAASISAVARLRGVFRIAVPIALIALPFAIGAPHAVDTHTSVPAALHTRFVLVTTIVSLISWQLLGGLLGWLRSRSAVV
ncbi:CbtA family protein [Agrobacterium tumefaciens]|uniref:CbtA family protein n=1 Tax=Agrobacterium tumefaciens TaxID=358 RepID=UPI001ADA75C9|nr:CbtA family protein [Agrobacterium tumefaciens]